MTSSDGYVWLCRLQQLWDCEVKSKGLYCASFGVVVARFSRSLLLLSLLINAFNVLFTFLTPVSYVSNAIVIIIIVIMFTC